MHVSQLSEPDMTRTRPSGSVVTEGYQRAYFIGAVSVQVLVTSSKMLLSTRPAPGIRLPPTMNARPSARRAWPTQNRSVTLFGTAVKAPSVGFHNVAVCPPCSGGPSKNSTLPFGKRIMWIETHGQLMGPSHCPTCAGVCAAAGKTPEHS